MCVCVCVCVYVHVALDRNPGPKKQYPTLAIDPRRSFKCMSP